MAKNVLYFKDIEKGKEFKPSKYKVQEDVIMKYCKAVGEKNPLFTDSSAAKKEGFPALLAPPTIAAIFSNQTFLEEVEIPPGGIHANQVFEFIYPAMAGDELTTTTKILDKFEAKGRKNVIVEAITKNQKGQEIVRSKMGVIWPE